MLVIRHKVTGKFWHRQDGWTSYQSAERFTADDFGRGPETPSVWIPPDGVMIADDGLFQAGQQIADAIAALNVEIEKATGAADKFANAIVLTSEMLDIVPSLWDRLVMRVDDAVVGSILRVEGWIARHITPLHMRAEKWARWKLVVQLDRFPSFCWTNLVLWAINPDLHDAADLFEETRDAGQCARTGQYPYCGKCAITGVHQATNPDAPVSSWAMPENDIRRFVTKDDPSILTDAMDRGVDLDPAPDDGADAGGFGLS